MTKAEATLGMRVEFTHKLHRTYESPRKVWRDIPIAGNGIVIGVRTLQNGTTRYFGSDEAPEWRCDSVLPALLIATHVRKAPIYVSPEHASPAPHARQT